MLAAYAPNSLLVSHTLSADRYQKEELESYWRRNYKDYFSYSCTAYNKEVRFILQKVTKLGQLGRLGRCGR